MLYLVEGPVGAGKSTFAHRLSLQHQAAWFDLDRWMVTLFSPDRPQHDVWSWYAECKTRCVAQIWQQAEQLLDLQQPVVLELGLVQAADRQSFYQRVALSDHPMTVYCLDVPEPVRRERVRQRNLEVTQTYKMDVSDEVFELANSLWQAPTDEEIRDHNIEVVAYS